MRQRLGIADALVKAPDLLILDEPTTSIDPLGVVEILDLLRRLVDERGLAILLSSHLLSQVQSVCDRIGIFAAGRLIGVGHGRRAGHASSATARAVIEVGLELPTPADVDRADDGARARSPRVESRRAPPTGQRARGGSTSGPPTEEGRVRQDILVAAVEHGLRLTALRPVVPSLDDIYRTRRRAAVAAARRGRETAAGRAERRPRRRPAA